MEALDITRRRLTLEVDHHEEKVDLGSVGYHEEELTLIVDDIGTPPLDDTGTPVDEIGTPPLACREDERVMIAQMKQQRHALPHERPLDLLPLLRLHLLTIAKAVLGSLLNSTARIPMPEQRATAASRFTTSTRCPASLPPGSPPPAPPFYPHTHTPHPGQSPSPLRPSTHVP